MNPQQAQMTHMMMSLVPIFLLFGLACIIFYIFLFWRILKKAGLAGPLAFIAIFPGIGQLVLLCVLAFSDWRVAPIPPPAYYPPAYPPTTPPTQL